jgi:type II secretory pathway pseudopilin PulG
MIIIIFCGYVLPSEPQNIKNSFNDSSKKDQILILDTALSSWFKTHGGKYPNNLNDLKAVELIPNSMDLSGYLYNVNSAKTKYRLTTTFSGSTVYISPLSNY